MSMKQKLAILVGIGLLALVAGFVAGPQLIRKASAMVRGPGSSIGEADWQFDGTTVAEQANYADLIVRVRVVKSETGVIRRSTALYEDPEGKTEVGRTEVTIPFTDSQMEILEVYKGSAESTITVHQTGGLAEALPADVRALTINGNPIFTVGSEHILFLKVRLNDNLDHPTYVIANPFSRYEVKDGRLMTAADVIVRREGEEFPAGLPTSLDELVEQIKQAVSETTNN